MEQRALRFASKVLPGPVKRTLGRMAIAFGRASGRQSTFLLGGREYHYLYHTYNLAWRNERSFEVPVVWEIASGYDPERVLEVGNVLSHYYPVTHEVIDLYERCPGVRNADAATFDPGRDYDLIISISTIEHIGWDEDPREAGKAAGAVRNLEGLLAPGGRLVMTVPLGQNPELDRLIEHGDLTFSELRCMERVSRRNEWREIDVGEAPGVCARGRFAGANAVYFCVLDKNRGGG